MADKPDTTNRFATRAHLLVEMTDAQARRLADAMEQPPANATDMLKQTDKLTQAWNYTTSQQPEQDFWQQHDRLLQSNLSKLPPDAPPTATLAAHNDAETKALQAVYPWRSELIGTGTRMLEDQVKTADRISRIASGKSEDQQLNQVVPQPMSGSSDTSGGSY